ncbi:hypothetical protein NQ314_016332 [Rhamnusium bicolor]|uniref:RRM domain-containing protein n=1 Tax=Rhamnusium bicolor TaxID=1586634 RepID=A0AAV8WXI7_9CUCU|nr:hypothetical protein NQ314_016332 [Rhamnusium bicolor]
MAVGSTKVVQVTNIAPQATKDQMYTLFEYLGKIDDVRLYPTIRDVSCPVQSRICYIKFMDVETVEIAQHMTNTVFIDRALIVVPVPNGEIPDEHYALEITRNGTVIPGLNNNEPKLSPNVVNSVQGSGTEQVILTTYPNLEAIGLPPYPPLPSNYNAAKIEETRRTILMLNVESSVTHDELINYFSMAGEVKYLRVCTQDSNNRSHRLVEFSDQSSIINALKMNGMYFKGRPVEIQHATEPIIKPQVKCNEAVQKEIEEAMPRFQEAQNMTDALIEPVIDMLMKDKRSFRRSHSRSRRRRSRSRSLFRRSRSRRRRYFSRSRSKSRNLKRRSKSRSRSCFRSRTRRSSSRSSKSRRSRSKSTSSKNRHRSKDRSSRAKSRDKERKSRDCSRNRRWSRDRDRKSNNRESKENEKDKSSHDSNEKRSDIESRSDVLSDKKRSRSRSKGRRRSRSRDRKIKERKRSRSRGSRRTQSPRSAPRKRGRSRSRDRKCEKKCHKRYKDRKERRSRSHSCRVTF